MTSSSDLNELCITPAKESDAGSVARLSNENSFAFQHEIVDEKFLLSMWKKPDFLLFVAKGAGELKGFCGVNYSNPLIAELGPICVEESARRTGLGTRLVGSIFDFLEKRPHKKVIIKVKTNNISAQRFFESLGFEKVEGLLCGDCPAILMQHEI